MRDRLPRRHSARTLSFLAIAFVTVLQASAEAQTKVSPQLSAAIEQIETTTATELAKDNLGSVTVGIISGRELIWAKSFGMADIEKKIPATTDSIYRIGSITKQFTALMLLQLVDAGRVHLTEPVEKYFPEIAKVQGRQAWYPSPTFIQLATMTSGLDREPEDLATYVKGPVSEWEKILISALPHVKYLFEPDTHYYYSNIGYAILGAALGRVAHEPYVDYVKEHIFTPLGMAHTAFEPNPDILPRIASGYDVGRDGKVDAETPAREHSGRGYKVPNGAIYTTVADLARFVSFEMGEGPDAVLNRRALADNFIRTNSSVQDLGLGYGIGFMVTRRGDFVYYGHGGSVAGYNAEADFDRGTKIGVVVLRNVNGGKFGIGSLSERLLMTAVAAAKSKTSAHQ